MVQVGEHGDVWGRREGGDGGDGAYSNEHLTFGSTTVAPAAVGAHPRNLPQRETTMPLVVMVGHVCCVTFSRLLLHALVDKVGCVSELSLLQRVIIP